MSVSVSRNDKKELEEFNEQYFDFGGFWAPDEKPRQTVPFDTPPKRFTDDLIQKSNTSLFGQLAAEYEKMISDVGVYFGVEESSDFLGSHEEHLHNADGYYTYFRHSYVSNRLFSICLKLINKHFMSVGYKFISVAVDIHTNSWFEDVQNTQEWHSDNEHGPNNEIALLYYHDIDEYKGYRLEFKMDEIIESHEIKNGYVAISSSRTEHRPVYDYDNKTCKRHMLLVSFHFDKLEVDNKVVIC